jgi:hypothetical protein
MCLPHRLEGSRFGAYPDDLANLFQRLERSRPEAAGGSRELPSANATLRTLIGSNGCV